MNTRKYFFSAAFSSLFLEQRRVFQNAEVPTRSEKEEKKENLQDIEKAIKETHENLMTLRGKVESGFRRFFGMEKQSPEQRREQILKSSENLKSQLSAESLLMLEEIAPGTLQKLFVEGGGRINFADNEEADDLIGLGDLLVSNPPFIQVTKPNGEVQIGSLQNGKRVGYFAKDGDYLEIHSGYSFQILTQLPESEKENFRDYEAPEEGILKNGRQNRIDIVSDIKQEKLKTTEGTLKKLNEIPANERAKYFQNMPSHEMANLRSQFSGKRIENFFRENGVDTSMTQAGELKNAISTILANTNSLPGLPGLVNTFSETENLTKTLLQLSSHESDFRPFAVSSTGCLGFYQFNKGNAKNYGINPMNPIEATEGVLKLWIENMNFLSKKGFRGNDLAKRIIIAHNRGAGNVTGDIASIGRDKYGNPSPDKFYSSVTNQEVDKIG